MISSIDKKIKYRIVAMIYPDGAWKEINNQLLLTAIELSQSGHDTLDHAWVRMIKTIQDSIKESEYTDFTNNSVLVNLGASWWIPNYVNVVSEIKDRFGAKYIPFIHDLIPMMVPEHCSYEQVCEFTQWSYATLLQADAVIVNSSQTAKDVKSAAQQIHGLNIEPIVCRLDAAPELNLGRNRVESSILRATSRPFVLFVSTIESRKNHLFIFDAWIELCRQHGEDNVPNLICVGKKGWLVETALARYNNSAILQRKVLILTNIGDFDLDHLYKSCKFTLYNSCYEGWGLPVTESLYFKKVPLIPRNTSLIEAGGHFAEYFLTGSLDSFLASARHLIFNDEYLKDRESAVGEYNCRTWKEVALEIVEVATTVRENTFLSLQARSVTPGTLYHFSFNKDASIIHDNLKGHLIRYGSGWHKPESWGVWTAESEAQIRINIKNVRSDILLYLQLVAHSPDDKISISINSSPLSRVKLSDSPNHCFRVRKRNADEADFELTISLVCDDLKDLREYTTTDERRIGVGVSSLLVCFQDDIHSRLTYIENFGRINMHGVVF
ncbi:glycosyltransferase [Methylorubrum thiocyanatum]|uniref:glycosyltransferase n=1 Tax=Methylorubrum thiocyanatum TaxID=47958 RepID=UPI00383BDFA9